MAPRPSETTLKVRIVFGQSGMLGPGKAELLELIRETGSIAAAGRRLGMSYKRAWTLVETMNSMFAEPLVRSSRGGASQGGAELTPAGAHVLDLYRAFVAKASSAGAKEIASLERLIVRSGDISRRK